MTISRPTTIEIGNTKIDVPIFFPSISTVKTTISPLFHVSVLLCLREKNKNLLISAFDLLREKDSNELISELRSAIDTEMIILMDSGNYESFWKNEKSNWTQQKFNEILREYPYTFAFGFDEQNPPPDINKHVNLLINYWHKDQEVSGNKTIIPIIHRNKKTNFFEICRKVAIETNAPMIAVAERELGDGIFERIQMVKDLRNALDDIRHYIGLHILGVGNPISIALYSWGGADSFDGLEWCRCTVDQKTGLLFHFSQSDFFHYQTGWSDRNLPFIARTLAHNIDFYCDWMRKLRASIHSNNFKEFCYLYFPKSIFKVLAKNLEWEQ